MLPCLIFPESGGRLALRRFLITPNNFKEFLISPDDKDKRQKKNLITYQTGKFTAILAKSWGYRMIYLSSLYLHPMFSSRSLCLSDHNYKLKPAQDAAVI